MTTLNAADVAAYLAGNPDFFAAYPELLATLMVPHPQNGQAISLVERQSLILRQRIGALEAHVSEFKRHGAESDAIVDKLIVWARALLAQDDSALLPDTAVEQMKLIFSVPHAALRLWDVAHAYREWACASPVSRDIRQLADSMRAPFAGANAGFEAAAWMHEDPAAIRSLAMLPLRAGAGAETFGLMVLGSGDRERFQASMGTDFLARFAELASAALARLRAVPAEESA
jgi:uncharacterized protein YigA (DUF484 family)